MISIREYDGTEINTIDESALTVYIAEHKQATSSQSVPRMSAVELMQWVSENHLEGEYLRVMNDLYKSFGMIGAPLGLWVTAQIYYAE